VKIGILSDIHSNGDALDAVLENAQSQGIDGWWCLGDVVGYGAEPDRVVERVRALPAITVAGNHDWAACGLVSTRLFNRHAAQAADWTANNSSPATLAWLKQLPLVERQNDSLLVHATPSAPEEWNYCMMIEDALFELEHFEEPLCVIGHSHYAGAFEKDGEDIRYTRAPELRLRQGRRYLAFIPTDGTANVYRKVTASVDNGDGTETLTLDTSTGKAFPMASTQVSFLVFARLASDEPEIHWISTDLATAILEVEEIPAEVPA
jgi:predicted phosphodiesterase